jgi:hypothetical protein
MTSRAAWSTTRVTGGDEPCPGSSPPRLSRLSPQGAVPCAVVCRSTGAGPSRRFKRDVRPSLTTRADALAGAGGGAGITAVVTERWVSEGEGELLVFIEQAACPREEDELADNWDW